MRVVASGSAAATTPITYRCLGIGDARGCGAVLEVQANDLFRLPYESWYSQRQRVAFECIECRAPTCVECDADESVLPTRDELPLSTVRRRIDARLTAGARHLMTTRDLSLIEAYEELADRIDSLLSADQRKRP